MNILTLRDRGNKFKTIYHAKVVDIEDPTKQGRIKVELPEVFGDSDPKQTPWIYPIGYNSGLRLFHVPDKDTEVGVIFIGDVYTGFYGIGKYSKGETKLFDEDYPNVYGFEDAQGNYFTINKKTGDVKFHHKSGTEFMIDDDGNTTAKIVGKLESEVEKNANLKIKEELSAEVGKDATVKIDGKLEAEVAKTVKLKAGGTVDIDAPKTNVGQGGPAIARVGDEVEVYVSYGDSGGTHRGKIISGGVNTSI